MTAVVIRLFSTDDKVTNWLRKERAIKNPYYGSQMLSCGKVVETINKKSS